LVLEPQPLRHKQSEYMQWAKTQQRATYTLATSGVGHYPLRELPVNFDGLEINGPNSYGYEPLQCAIARHHGVDPDCVVEAAGTSMANHLAMAAILEPGDQVLIEQPVYGPILDAALYLEADVRRFVRRADEAWAVDPAAVRGAVSARTRLIVLTNLHNPSSALTGETVLREIGDIARSVGALVLVDEVYLDAVYEGTPPTSFHLGPEFVVTSSLTKVYGLSGLRCGWILARPELAWKIRRLNDVFGATPVFPGEWLSVEAFRHLELLREKARRVVQADRVRLQSFLAEQAAFRAVPADWGTTCFVKLLRGSVDPFLERLRRDFDTSAVPGRFFESPEWFRVGMGVDSTMFAEGLARLARALNP
jgi:aspartate/methionine/tyrosine aminotransferase